MITFIQVNLNDLCFVASNGNPNEEGHIINWKKYIQQFQNIQDFKIPMGFVYNFEIFDKIQQMIENNVEKLINLIIY